MKKNTISYAKLYINDNELTYQIRYSQRAKYIRLQINPSTGLEVVLPRRCKVEEAEKFVNKKKEWISKYLKAVPLTEEFSYLGKKLEINQKFNLFLYRHKVSFSKNVLSIESPAGSDDKVETIYTAWLRHVAKSYLPERTQILAQKHGFIVKQIRVRSQKTRWGNCSTSGRISLNYRLMKYRKEVIDYVIIHELCHLKELNHSKKFWRLVETIIPDYKLLKKELKSDIS
jgi:predicted metal-dependent hydrolase